MQHSTKLADRFSLSQITVTALIFMMSGIIIELFLLDHFEGLLQLIPIICIGISLPAVIVLFFKKTQVIVGLFKVLLLAMALSGLAGIYLHLKANFEFEQEMTPTAGNWELLLESLSGALPALAPGSMIALALIGYTFLIILLREKQ